jgi:hypothetical protein
LHVANDCAHAGLNARSTARASHEPLMSICQSDITWTSQPKPSSQPVSQQPARQTDKHIDRWTDRHLDNRHSTVHVSFPVWRWFPATAAQPCMQTRCRPTDPRIDTPTAHRWWSVEWSMSVGWSSPNSHHEVGLAFDDRADWWNDKSIDRQKI